MKLLYTSSSKKQLSKCPEHIRNKFDYWVDLISDIGLLKARIYKGFHDEPLLGRRKGQRSVRLSKSYRVIYREIDKVTYEIIEIIEVTKHEY